MLQSAILLFPSGVKIYSSSQRDSHLSSSLTFIYQRVLWSSNKRTDTVFGATQVDPGVLSGAIF